MTGDDDRFWEPLSQAWRASTDRRTGPLPSVPRPTRGRPVRRAAVASSAGLAHLVAWLALATLAGGSGPPLIILGLGVWAVVVATLATLARLRRDPRPDLPLRVYLEQSQARQEVLIARLDRARASLFAFAALAGGGWFLETWWLADPAGDAAGFLPLHPGLGVALIALIYALWAWARLGPARARLSSIESEIRLEGPA